MFENIDVKKFSEMIKEKDIIILDIRTLQEVRSGYVKGAIHIDFYSNDFKEKLDELERTKKYLVYCHSGGRSTTASKLMKQMNFHNVYNLSGGVGALMRKHFPLIR